MICLGSGYLTLIVAPSGSTIVVSKVLRYRPLFTFTLVTVLGKHEQRSIGGSFCDSFTGCSISSGTGVWLTYICDVPPTCPTAQPFFPQFYLPKPNPADIGTAKIKVNPTKVRELMEHPVVSKVENSPHLGDHGAVRVERPDRDLAGQRAEEGGREPHRPRGEDLQPLRQHPRAGPPNFSTSTSNPSKIPNL